MKAKIKSDYCGTFASDRLPTNRTGLMVSNTDPAHLPGTHWVAIYISKDRRCGEFFDSFGRPPGKHFTEYLDKNCSNWTYNRRQLQSVASKFCGHYCVLYCVWRHRGVDMSRFVNFFTRDTGFNDALVRRAFRTIA